MSEIDDLSVKEEILNTLALDPRVGATNVEVAVVDGVVTLSGAAANEEARRAAEELARDVEGVREIHNQIQVGSPRPVRLEAPRGMRAKMGGEGEMDLSEGDLEPPMHEENTQVCPNCGAEFPDTGAPEMICPECDEHFKAIAGQLDEWGRLHRHA